MPQVGRPWGDSAIANVPVSLSPSSRVWSRIWIHLPEYAALSSPHTSCWTPDRCLLHGSRTSLFFLSELCKIRNRNFSRPHSTLSRRNRYRTATIHDIAQDQRTTLLHQPGPLPICTPASQLPSQRPESIHTRPAQTTKPIAASRYSIAAIRQQLSHCDLSLAHFPRTLPLATSP